MSNSKRDKKIRIELNKRKPVTIRNKPKACSSCGKPVMFESHSKCINCMNKENNRLPNEGEWFEGNVFKGNFTSTMLQEKMKTHGTKVKAPHALRTKTVNGKEFSQFYYKPIQRGEFTD